MASLGNEREAVQNPLIRYASEVGWSYLDREPALTLRRGEGGMLLYPTLEAKLVALNPGVVDVETAPAVVARIEAVHSNIEGNAEVLAWLRGERSVLVASEARQRNVVVIDFDHPANNLLQVTSEWTYTNGQHENRADVVFLINGIPVAVVETKSATKPDGMDIAWGQIRRYHRETPEMMTAPQVFDITHLLDFFYGATWSLERRAIHNWRDEQPGNFERKVKAFFARERFLRLLGEWIVVFRRNGELQKVILRQHQTRAAERVVERALDPAKRSGLVWHTQGAGKTLTMMKAADLILHQPGVPKPTVVMLVDRNELESQLFQNLRDYGLDHQVVASKRHLRELLASDFRGLIVSMIHKFDRADAGMCERENVYVLVDEAHRSTSGELGNYLLGGLPRATLIGFTGTPIDRIAYGRGTFKTFGKDDAKGYLDKYTMAESIADGTTLPLRYSLAPNHIRVPEDLLEREFLALAETEGISDIEELNRILDRAVRLKTFLKAGDRVAAVAKFVAEDFRARVEPMGYKAFLVGVDREACALYKKELDRHLPPEYSRVVYTSPHNDAPHLAEFRLAEDEEQRLRRAFTKPGENPKILIVTEKLLTGFDAPILYCMYLDKPMRDHTLLQAIARVNRPYEDARGFQKPVGYVVDFIGIFRRLKDALAFDDDEVAHCIEDAEKLQQRFATLMSAEAAPFVALARTPGGDKATEAALEALHDKGRRETFLSLFAEIENLYEILSPDAFLRPYLEDYAALAALHQLCANAFRRRGALTRELMHKTEALIRSRVGSSPIAPAGRPVLLDEKALRALKQQGGGGAADVINCANTVIAAASEPGQPHLASIAERAENILEGYDDAQISTGEALVRLAELVEEFEEAQRQRAARGLPEAAFQVFWTLRQAGIADAEPLALALEAAFAQRPSFKDNPAERRELKAEIYKILLPVAAPGKIAALADRIWEGR